VIVYFVVGAANAAHGRAYDDFDISVLRHFIVVSVGVLQRMRAHAARVVDIFGQVGLLPAKLQLLRVQSREGLAGVLVELLQALGALQLRVRSAGREQPIAEAR
jgi:hypothetical protein